MQSSRAEATALARALTGETLPVEAEDQPGLVAELEALGWDRARLRRLRADRMDQRLPWPFPVDPAVLRELGFARFRARLQELLTELGLLGRQSVAPSPGRPPTPDETRLIAQRPPHWG